MCSSHARKPPTEVSRRPPTFSAPSGRRPPSAMSPATKGRSPPPSAYSGWPTRSAACAPKPRSSPRASVCGDIKAHAAAEAAQVAHRQEMTRRTRFRANPSLRAALTTQADAWVWVHRLSGRCAYRRAPQRVPIRLRRRRATNVLPPWRPYLDVERLASQDRFHDTCLLTWWPRLSQDGIGRPTPPTAYSPIRHSVRAALVSIAATQWPHWPTQ